MMKMILLSISGHKFSSSLNQVRHIVSSPEIFPLVCLRRGIIGAFLYEDKPIPIIDPEVLPVLEKVKVQIGGEYLIVFQSEYGNVGIPVDAAVTIVDVEDGLFENVAPTDENPQGDPLFCLQGVSYPLLDINEMLTNLTDF